MRWKALIPTLLIVAILAAGTFFFLDSALECAIEQVGSSANGAKVEVADVDLSLLGLSLNIRGLQVTDKDKPMTNLVEIDSLSFNLAGKPLTWKKIVIEEGTLSGIRTGTPRKSSGALSPKKKPASAEAGRADSPQEPAKGKQWAQQSGTFVMANLKDQYDPQKLVQLENLAAYKKIEENKQQVAQLSDKWKTKTNALGIEKKSDAVKALVEKAKNQKIKGLDSLGEIKKLLDESKSLRKDIQQSKKEVASLSGQFQSELQGVKGQLKEIDALQKNDIDKVVGDIQSKAFSAEGLSKGLVGPSWFERIQKTLGLVRKARSYIPKKKEKKEKAPPPPPREGRTIHFPFHHNWPRFHLKTAAVSGTTSGENPLAYSGTLEDVTSDPAALGRPLTLALSGSKDNSPEKLVLRLILDYTSAIRSESIQLSYTGLPLAGKKLGNIGAPVGIQDGSGVVQADVRIREEELQGTIQFNAQPVTLDYSLEGEQRKNRLLNIVQDVLAGLDQLNVNILLSGTLASPDFRIRTNLDNLFNKAIKDVFEKEMAEIKKQLRQRVQSLIGEHKGQLIQSLHEQTSGVMGQIKGKEKLVGSLDQQAQKLLDDLANKNKPAVPENLKKNLKNLFGN